MDTHEIKFSQPLPPHYKVEYFDGHYHWTIGEVVSVNFCCRWMAYRSAWNHFYEFIEPKIQSILERHHYSDPGWWGGHQDLIEEIDHQYHVKLSVETLKKVLRKMRKESKIISHPIFSESTGLLNGSGYFPKIASSFFNGH